MQTKTGFGPQKLLRRAAAGDWFVDEPREIIRLGLIGGGTTPADALRLIRIYYDERPFLENLALAVEIVSAALVVPEGDEPKKANRRGGNDDDGDGQFVLPTSMAPAP